MKTIPAIIHATVAAGSTAAPYYVDVNITQTLCNAACCDEKPVFVPQFSVNSIESVGTSQYLINAHVEGVLSYIPCGCGSCSTRTQIISQDFSIPVSATSITGATITAGASQNVIQKEPCCHCSKTFVSDTPIQLAITTE